MSYVAGLIPCKYIYQVLQHYPNKHAKILNDHGRPYKGKK